MRPPEAVLESVLQSYVEELKKKEEKLISCVQFGSTTRGTLKRETDIDVLLVFKTLPPSRIQRSQVVSDVETLCLDQLHSQLPKDYHLYFSSVLRTYEESSKFSLLYLDMVDHSKILYDTDGFAASLLQKSRQWIQESGSYRVEKGLKWYWVFGNVSWDKEQKIGW